MPLLTILLFVAGIGLLVLGADLLVRGVERRFFRSVHPDWRDPDAVPKSVNGILNQIYLAEWPPMKAKRIFMEAAKKVMG